MMDLGRMLPECTLIRTLEGVAQAVVGSLLASLDCLSVDYDAELCGVRMPSDRSERKLRRKRQYAQSYGRMREDSWSPAGARCMSRRLGSLFCSKVVRMIRSKMAGPVLRETALDRA